MIIHYDDHDKFVLKPSNKEDSNKYSSLFWMTKVDSFISKGVLFGKPEDYIGDRFRYFCNNEFHNIRDVAKVQELIAGSTCKKCNTYSDYPVPNQSDGTFICYGCRSRYALY